MHKSYVRDCSNLLFLSYKDSKCLFAFSYSFKSVFDFSNKIATISAMVTKVHMGNAVSDIAKDYQVIIFTWIELLYYSVLGIGGDLKMRN